MFHPRTASPLSPLRWGLLLSRRPSGLVTPLISVVLNSSPRRWKKTRTTVALSDLPQGPLPVSSLPVEPPRDEPAFPTVVQQARNNMHKYDNCVLLTRVGGFYELYFEHAEEYGPLLNLKVASKKTSAGRVPMAGFPIFQLDRFLKIFVQDMNRYVAIAEEFPNDAADKIKSGGLMHDRRVARVVTPGTLIDENFMDPYSNNYVMALHMGPPTGGGLEDHEGSSTASPASPASQSLGMAWLDLSTGHFYTQRICMSTLSAILSGVGPREIVLAQSLEAHPDPTLAAILDEDRHVITYSGPSEIANISEWTPFLESEVPASTRCLFSAEEVEAGNLVLHYVKERLLGSNLKLQTPQRRDNMQLMNIDKNTLRALEVKQTIRDGFFKGSLLHAIRRTVTKSGARLLADWLTSPSTSLGIINARQDLVACFIQHIDLRDSIIHHLRRCHDSQRLVQKFALGRGDPDDLLAVANTVQATSEVLTLLQDNAESGPLECVTSLVSRVILEGPRDLSRRIREAIDEEGLDRQHAMDEEDAVQMTALAQDVLAAQGSPEDIKLLPKGKKKRAVSLKDFYGEDNQAWIMNPAASPSLQKLHKDLDQLMQDKLDLHSELRQCLGAPSLTLKWTPGLGHIAHIKGKDVKTVTDVRTLSSTRSTRSFHLSEWTALGQRIDTTCNRIRAEEQRVFQSLREQVVLNLVKLRRNAAVLDELDVVTSFAKLAVEQNLVRPILNNSTAHQIIGGRHATVEGGLFEQGRSFVRNDCLVGSPSNGRLWLVTGPNMAGKSTFLRQNALITILAQVGCYVPATFAEIGLVDAIFSRVGSADNLYRDQSTFMVEMLETAHILQNATSRSFVIMDEIGRGTTPEDGTSVSYACLHHLVTVNKCRSLFATHFHAVADLAADDSLCGSEEAPVQLYCTDVEEDEKGGFVYVHKLRRGINRSSHALKVARLAGLPEEAISKARQALGRYTHGELQHHTEIAARG